MTTINTNPPNPKDTAPDPQADTRTQQITAKNERLKAYLARLDTEQGTERPGVEGTVRAIRSGGSAPQDTP